MPPVPLPDFRPELLYLHDPLCGWCYGLSPVIQQLKHDYAGRLDVTVLCGGMAVGERAGPIKENWGYIKDALGDVERATGVQFGAAFRQLAEAGDYVYDSEPPSRAIVAFRQLEGTRDPGRAVPFAHDVQAALFRDGQDLNEAATYQQILTELYADVDAAAWEARWRSPDAARATQQEFAAVARTGVRGFPTVVLRLGEQGYVLARGYQSYTALAANVEAALRQADAEG
ncbi:DsbA family protein [uncultured Hymenobacter sp.]|uniref:DsbA family protein n=1 Tax=uncultured Hymenobacter sp. TaxID=170016 RepID=UPI0035C99BF7